MCQHASCVPGTTAAPEPTVGGRRTTNNGSAEKGEVAGSRTLSRKWSGQGGKSENTISNYQFVAGGEGPNLKVSGRNVPGRAGVCLQVQVDTTSTGGVRKERQRMRSEPRAEG